MLRMKLATVVALAAVLSCPAQVLAGNSCTKISGHISGQIIGPTPACGGALTEIGSFTGNPKGTFVACVTSMKDHGGGVLVFKLVHTFFKITVPSNWDTYSDTEPTVWNPQYPTASIVTADSFGNPQVIGNLNDFFHSYFKEPVQQPALTKPAVPGVGSLWVDTEFESTAHKDKPGTSTKIDASDWSVQRKVALPQIDMNNPHNMWTDAAGKLVYQTEWWSNRLDVWDPGTSAWTAAASLPSARSHIAAATFSLGGRIISIGGETSFGTSTAQVIAYNPVSNSWAQLSPLPVARNSGAGGAVNGTLYYATGTYFSNTTYKGVPLP